LIPGFLARSKASLGGSRSLLDLSGEGQAVLRFMTHLNRVGQTGSTPRHPKWLSTCCHGEEPHVVDPHPGNPFARDSSLSGLWEGRGSLGKIAVQSFCVYQHVDPEVGQLVCVAGQFGIRKGIRSVPVLEAGEQYLVGNAASEQIAEFLSTAAGPR
jgi:hypothetical protein